MQRVWPAVLDKLAETAPALAATFEGARPVGVRARRGSQIGFPAEHDLQQDARPRRRSSGSRWRRRCRRSPAQALRPTYVLLDGEAGAAGGAGAAASEEIDEEELLERLKSEFDAEEVS